MAQVMITPIGRSVYRRSCPNCGRSISEARLNMGLPCERCIPKTVEGDVSLESVYKALLENGTLNMFKEVYVLEGEARRLAWFFEKTLGYPPWGAQRTWIKRFVRGDSFTIIAPTGVGKTTFGIIVSLYLACVRGEKSYVIVPTTTLVIQAEEKARNFASKVACTPRIVAVHGRMRKAEKEKALEHIKSGDFDVLISTIAFARKNLEILEGRRFKFVFVDDVDAVLKSGRSVDAILRIVGFTEEDIDAGLRILNLQREIARLQYEGEGGGEERRRKVEELRVELERYRGILRGRNEVSRLIVSSATGRPRGSKVRLFRVLLGFEAGGRGDVGLRNVVDAYVMPSGSVEEEVVRIVKRLGSGTLVYVPLDSGIEGAERLAELLRNAGVNAKAYHARTPFKVLREFMDGEVDVLVGVANYYGALVRGIDLPKRVKYAVFAGVPRHKFSAEIGEPHPARLSRVLSLLSEVNISDVAESARRYLAEMRRMLRRFSPAYLQFLSEKVLEGDVESGGRSARVLAEAYDFVRRALEDPEVWREIESRSDVGVIVEGGRKYLLIADVVTYIQASGRTSRLYSGGITKGFSVVVVDNMNVFRGLMDRSRIIADVKWSKLEDVPMDKLIEEIEEDREKVSRILEGKVVVGELVKSALLVVESPNKARTIASFFGQPSVRLFPGGLRVYEVTIHNLVLSIAASGGHVFELVPRASEEDVPSHLEGAVEGDVFGVISIRSDGSRFFAPVFSSIKRCLSCGHQFTDDRSTCPRCGSPRIRDSFNTIEDLRRIAWEVDMVLVGTDPDTEGEKIGWDLALLLKPFNKNIYRLEFHEVTRTSILRALEEALEERRGLRERLVEAQLVRRIEDRWIGFTLSPLLWCYFWPYYCSELRERGVSITSERCSEPYNFNLSAGRVQTPALGWVVNRYEESRKATYVYTLHHNGTPILVVREGDVSPVLASELRKIAREGGEVEIEVSEVSREEVTISPPPPYTTDSMIADASRLLGMGAPETMRLAQDLFEWGLITYHRTDSTRVSERGVEVAEEYIRSKFGDLAEALYRPRRWGEGGAHEAIRPVRPVDMSTLQLLVEEGALELPGRLTQRHLRLYDMIFRRFIASQMREAVMVKARYAIDLLGHKLDHSRILGSGAGGDVSRGFTLIWGSVRVEEPLKPGYLNVRVRFRRVGAKQPYTEGELVEEMKSRGIGRPSTYAKIVETLIKRGYVVPLKKPRGYIVASRRGRYVFKFLVEDLAAASEDLYGRLAHHLRRVPQLISEERTRVLERLMDEVEEGRRGWVEVLNEIYDEIEGLSLPIRLIMLSERRVQEEVPGELRECLERAKRVFEGGEV
jgi:reverse gyrase